MTIFFVQSLLWQYLREETWERLLYYNLPGRVSLKSSCGKDRIFSPECRAVVPSPDTPGWLPKHRGAARAVPSHPHRPPVRKTHLLFIHVSFLLFGTSYHLYILFILSPLTSYTNKFPACPSRRTCSPTAACSAVGSRPSWPR